MPRRKPSPVLSEESSEDEPLSITSNKYKNKKLKETTAPNKEESSSESDIESYLQPINKIDLNSSFFHIKNDNQIVQKNVTEPSTSLNTEPENTPETSYYNFNQLTDYAKKIEETKKAVEKYNAKKQSEVTEVDVLNLLTAGEAKSDEDKEKILSSLQDSLHSSDFESCSESDKEAWEEVKTSETTEKPKMPKEGLQIVVEMPGVLKKKKGTDLLMAMKRRFNRIKKENQVLMHKVHILCWIAHGNYVNKCINSQNILAMALSLLPSENCYPADRTDLNYLEQILKWYRKTVTNLEKVVPKNLSLENLLEKQINKKETFNKKNLVYIFIAILRSLGIQCRLVLSFQVLPLKPPMNELCSLSSKTTDEKKSAKNKETKESVDISKPSTSKSDDKTVPKSTQKKAITDKSKLRSSAVEQKEIARKTRSNSSPLNKNEVPSSKQKTSKSKMKVESDSEKKLKTKSKTGKDNDERKDSKKEAAKRKLSTRSKKVPQVDGNFDSDSEDASASNKPKRSKSRPNLKKLKEENSKSCPIKNHPKRLRSQIKKYRDTDSEDDFQPDRSPFSPKNTASGANLKKLRSAVSKKSSSPNTNVDKGSNKYFGAMDVRSDIINIVKGSIKDQSALEKMKKVKKRKPNRDNDDDSDYALESIKKKHHDSEDEFKPKVKQRVKPKKVLSSDSEDASNRKKKGVDVWVEVFLESEEKWISVDVIKGQVHCVNELYNRASHPVSYVVAWSNNNSLKDVTKRYCQKFNTITRKLRVDAKWWQATIKPFEGPRDARIREEDDELERQQSEKPLPTSIAEYKNHPLYVLKRHLLKFEAIYPPDAPTLGFVRNEPVYSRLCVYTLHSREIWLKHAKVVKLGEKPYKIVKARPKYDKLSNTVITDQLLEIFGPWQTEDYVPPTAENGIVPRNAYGNVELFKACMLPKKTVHLQLPGLNKVAKRMNIDCAPAVIGFDFHSGWSHPTFDGFVVCEESADILIAAWHLDQEEMEKKEQEKIEKRVYGNWRKLIKGLLIRERLKNKYEFGEPSGGQHKKKNKGPRLVTKKRKICSDSESD